MQNLGAFGPLKCREIYALDKLEKQSSIIEELLKLAKTASQVDLHSGEYTCTLFIVTSPPSEEAHILFVLCIVVFFICMPNSSFIIHRIFCLACDDKSRKRDIGITFPAAASSTIVRQNDKVLYISKSIQAIHFKLEIVIQYHKRSV